MNIILEKCDEKTNACNLNNLGTEVHVHYVEHGVKCQHYINSCKKKRNLSFKYNKKEDTLVGRDPS